MTMIEAFDSLARKYEQELEELRDENARLSRMMEKLATAARDAADTIEQAMDVHIYDADNGEEPDEDCGYTATVKELRDLATESENLFASDNDEKEED